jgi:CHASE3 domain sensor protein
MKYARQVQEHLDRFDQSLAQLRNLIKRNQNREALHFMEEGAMKERFEELQNVITMASTSTLGSRGTSQTGTL